MAEETTKFQVGEGTQAQIIIQMTPLGTTPDNQLNLSNLNFEVTFIGKGEYKVSKNDDDVTALLDEYGKKTGQYEILVDTSKTGKASELMAVLKVSGIPTQGGKTRIEVTPQIPTGIEVV